MQTPALPQSKEEQLYSAILDLIPFGIIVLDASGHVLQLNQLAGLITEQADGLKLRHNCLCATNPRSQQDLCLAMKKAGTANAPCAENATGIVSLGRSAGRESLEVLITPVRRQHPVERVPHAPCMAVLIWDPEKTPPLRCDRIRHLYKLTAAEARVTEGLVRGLAVIELAREMRVQTNTIRTHLKRIYDKTGARRQSELVRLFAGNLLLNMP